MFLAFVRLYPKQYFILCKMRSKSRETVVEETEIAIKLYKEGKSLRKMGKIIGKSHASNELKKLSTKQELDPSFLPSIHFNGHINYVRGFNACAMTCDDIIREVENSNQEIVPIGFDLEWPFSFQTGSGKVALAQICLSNSVCHLLHIHSLNKLPAAFVVLLSHSKVKLVGVNIKNDIWKLGRDFKGFPACQIVENNCVDSGTFANRVLNRSCRWSLERLTAYLLKKKLDKNSNVRRSKWHVYPLSEEQKIYAATDAYVSWLLHKYIQEEEDVRNINK